MIILLCISNRKGESMTLLADTDKIPATDAGKELKALIDDKEPKFHDGNFMDDALLLPCKLSPPCLVEREVYLVQHGLFDNQ